MLKVFIYDKNYMAIHFKFSRSCVILMCWMNGGGLFFLFTLCFIALNNWFVNHLVQSIRLLVVTLICKLEEKRFA